MRNTTMHKTSQSESVGLMRRTPYHNLSPITIPYDKFDFVISEDYKDLFYFIIETDHATIVDSSKVRYVQMADLLFEGPFNFEQVSDHLFKLNPCFERGRYDYDNLIRVLREVPGMIWEDQEGYYTYNLSAPDELKLYIP